MNLHRVSLLLAVVAVFSVCAMAADVSGTWTAKVEGKEGRVYDLTMNLKAAGDALSGTVSNPMGGESPISDGKVSGDKVSFKVKREFGDRTMIFNYEGTAAGDEIKFKQTIEGMDRPPREFTAKRAK